MFAGRCGGSNLETLTHQSGGVTLLSNKAPGLCSFLHFLLWNRRMAPPKRVRVLGETKCDEYLACMLVFLGSPDF